MPKLIDDLLSTSDTQARKRTIAELEQLEELPREGIDALRACLHDPDPELVEAALVTLIRHGHLSDLHNLLDGVHGERPGLAGRLLERTLSREVETVAEFVELLGSGNLHALLASERLVEHGESVVPLMIELIERHVDSRDSDEGWWRAQSLMYWAGRVLRRLGPRASAAAPVLCMIFTRGDPYRDTTHQAKQALRAMGASVIPVVRDSLTGELEFIASEIVRSIAGPSA